MQPLRISLLTISLLCVLSCGKAPDHPGNDQVISWQTILSDAADTKHWMAGSVLGKSRLFSSALDVATVSLTSYAPEHYGDLDHGSFLEVYDVDGGVEAVLAEMHGAGAVSWMWSANPAGTLVLEIDGTKTEQSFQSFLAGRWLPKRGPFASKTAGGYNLHFPILHKKHCRVLVQAKSRAELGSLFYQIAWNALETDKAIESFNVSAIRKSGGELKRVADRWMEPPVFNLAESRTLALIPGEWCDAVTISGRGLFELLEIKAGSKAELAGLNIDFYWDGHNTPSLSCPLYMLCGISDRFENVESLPVSVDGAMATVRWPMPFGNGARIRLQNTGDSPVECALLMAFDREFESPDRFCGKFSEHQDIPSEGKRTLTLAEVQDEGSIVGCIMQVENQSDGWWGEGDPVIWLDGAENPGWHGTGTEDYFGFAWCSNKEFQHPLRGQTRADLSFAAMYRYHLLDALPFSGGARFGFEAHGIGTGSLNYSTLVLWYSDTSFMND